MARLHSVPALWAGFRGPGPPPESVVANLDGQAFFFFLNWRPTSPTAPSTPRQKSRLAPPVNNRDQHPPLKIATSTPPPPRQQSRPALPIKNRNQHPPRQQSRPAPPPPPPYWPNYWPPGIFTLSNLALFAKSLDTPAVRVLRISRFSWRTGCWCRDGVRH